MGSYLDLDDAAAGHPKAEHELHLMREHIKGLESALEELETLRAENAKLIAGRDERQKIPDCKFGDNIVWFLREFENAEKEYLEEGCLEIYGEDANGREGSCEITVNEICREAANVIEKLLAEREAMMKQEPVYILYRTLYDDNRLPIDTAFDEVTEEKYKEVQGIQGKDFYGEIFYRNPLPAQQIPEGYALDSERLNFLMQRGARIGWSRDGEKCAVYGNEPDEFNTLIRYNGSKCFDDPREAIDHAMLSASQPKGEIICPILK